MNEIPHLQRSLKLWVPAAGWLGQRCNDRSWKQATVLIIIARSFDWHVVRPLGIFHVYRKLQFSTASVCAASKFSSFINVIWSVSTFQSPVVPILSFARQSTTYAPAACHAIHLEMNGPLQHIYRQLDSLSAGYRTIPQCVCLPFTAWLFEASRT